MIFPRHVLFRRPENASKAKKIILEMSRKPGDGSAYEKLTNM
jgi:hypothetical protein